MIVVLRLGHRPARDKRITTHVALVARVFGADKMLISTWDDSIEKTLRDVVRKFGGPFEIESGVDWRRTLKDFRGYKVHLTMYGMAFEEGMSKVPRDKDIMVVVGAEKVPRLVYDMVDLNLSVSNQPHSEVAALAIFLDRLKEGQWAKKTFHGRVRIVPSSRGKDVRNVKSIN